MSESDEVIVNLGDIQDKFLSLKIRDKMIDKTTIEMRFVFSEISADRAAGFGSEK